MADISDVCDALADLALAACFPNGTGKPGVSTNPVFVAQGWPHPDTLSKAINASPQQTMVTIFPLPGMSSSMDQPMQFTSSVVTAPVHGMAASLGADETTVTFTGVPGVGEYATAVIDGLPYGNTAIAGDTVETVAAALARQIPGASWARLPPYATLSIPDARTIEVRIGAPATLGEVVGRQKERVRITVWAPNPGLRSQVARAVDVAVKTNVGIDLSDGSRALLHYVGGGYHDNLQNEGEYRRDIDVDVTYDTFMTYPGYEILFVSASLSPP